MANTYTQIHILFGFQPTQSLYSLLQDIKGSSSKLINEQKFVKGRFSWQEGFGAFSDSKSEISKISDYIDIQNRPMSIICKSAHPAQACFSPIYQDFAI